MRFRVLSGPAVGAEAEVSGELLIGRSADGIGNLGGDDLLSRSHARLAAGPDGAGSVSDLGSRNGTRVNGVAISETHALQPRDRISLGRSELEIVGLAAHAADRVTANRRTLAQTGLHHGGSAALLVGSDRYEVPDGGLTVGRAPDNDIVLSGESVSRRQARVGPSLDGWSVIDLSSAGSTRVNGAKIGAEAQSLSSGDEIGVGEHTLRFVLDARTTATTQVLAPAPPHSRPERTVTSLGRRVGIGRDPRNDCVLDDPNVSRFHAVVTSRDGVTTIRDLGSRNGTYVDGGSVEEAVLDPDSEIGIGPFTLAIARSHLTSERRTLSLVAREVGVNANGREILRPTSLTVSPGTFLAIIGGSGAGKTTLMKTLAGVTSPSCGEVTINGDPLSVRQSTIGYVPQDEIVHGLLTVREALRYAALLRLPDDTARREIDEILRAVLDELDLEERAGSRVAVLSGGQRKRAGVGTELVSRPHLLFLDEATTGLDPVLERRMMDLMAALAQRGRTVITVTHATRNLELCDALAVMGAGGRLCFYGSPPAARAFFRVDETEQIYPLVGEDGASRWQQRFSEHSPELRVPSRRHSAGNASDPRPEVARAGRTGLRRRGTALRLQILSGGSRTDTGSEAPALGSGDVRRRSATRQTRILTARYARIFLRDRRNLLLLLGQVPLLAAATAGLYPSAVWSAAGDAKDVSGLVFLMVTIAIWVGAITASREIIKEKVVVEREAAIGVGRAPYLLSKLAVLGLLGTIQAVVLVGTVVLIRPAMPHQLQVLSLVLLTIWVSIAMGLLISASVETENQSVSLIPLALIPQLLFAGQIVPYGSMPSVLKAISAVVFARWAFAGVGHAVDIPGRLSPQALAHSYGHDFFASSVAYCAGVLAVFFLVFTAITLLLLRRRWP